MHPLKKRRLAIGLSRSSLAKKIGVTFETVRLWETTERCPSEEYYPKLAKALKTSAPVVVQMFSSAVK